MNMDQYRQNRHKHCKWHKHKVISPLIIFKHIAYTKINSFQTKISGSTRKTVQNTFPMIFLKNGINTVAKLKLYD